MGREPKDELFQPDQLGRRAQELEQILATSKRLIEELKALMESSRRLVRETETIIESSKREAAKRGK